MGGEGAKEGELLSGDFFWYFAFISVNINPTGNFV